MSQERRWTIHKRGRSWKSDGCEWVTGPETESPLKVVPATDLEAAETRAQTAEEVVELVAALNPDAVGGNELALAAIKKARSALAPIEEGTG